MPEELESENELVNDLPAEAHGKPLYIDCTVVKGAVKK
jgi:hypothetical protein